MIFKETFSLDFTRVGMNVFIILVSVERFVVKVPFLGFLFPVV